MEVKNKKRNRKKKICRHLDGCNTSDLYRGQKYPFDIDYIRHTNERTGGTQIIFLYLDKRTKKILKYRIL